MAQRKDVFTSKVLHKMYPAAPGEISSATIDTNVFSKKPFAKRTTPVTSSSPIGRTSTPAKRIYTALPPPANYKTDAEKSVTLSAPETIKSVEDPAEKSEDKSSDETGKAKDPEESKRSRRRRKKRKDHMPATAVIEEEERMSKNKKRKLKKKRHKEKLLSLGLAPRAAAVEFTFQREGLRLEEGNEEEEESCQVDEPGQDCRGNP
ncbi:uncharacterized protein erich1 [Eucyclogobius newberryi]|uniref:uncharacterized protein erich1 n=1 Tax=Eucyclogobius newberryi TaxID=166745 RepID=UPI003B59225D